MTQTTEADRVVSQDAREAAAKMWRAAHLRPETEWQSDWMLNGTADEGPVVQAFQRAMTQAADAERARVRTVFLPAILHGDEAHRAWLAAAVDAYIASAPIPPPTGKGNSEQAADAAYRRGVEDAAKVADWRAGVWRGLEGPCAISLQEECEDIASAIRNPQTGERDG